MPGPWDANLISPNAATTTATTNHTGFNFGEGAQLRIQAEVSGTVSGTSPTLDMKLQDSADGSSYADTGVTFPQCTATGYVRQREWTTKAGRPWVRAVSTVGGTSASFGSHSVRYGSIQGRETTPAAT